MKYRSSDGFSLPEMLVTISLIGLIVGALAGGLRIGTRAWESGRSSSSYDEAMSAARAISSQFERAFPAQVQHGQDAPILAFIGDPHSCRFVTLNKGEAYWGGPVTTEIAIDGVDRLSLHAWTSVFREDQFNQKRSAMQETKLLSRLAYFRVTYFGSPDSAQTSTWHDTWRDATRLPRLVSVHIGLNTPSGLREASSTVELRQQ